MWCIVVKCVFFRQSQSWNWIQKAFGCMNCAQEWIIWGANGLFVAQNTTEEFTESTLILMNCMLLYMLKQLRSFNRVKKKSCPCFSEGQMMSTQRTGRKSFFAFTVPFQTTCCTCLCFSCPWAQIKWIHSYAGVWPDSVSFYLHKFSKRPLKEIHQEL